VNGSANRWKPCPNPKRTDTGTEATTAKVSKPASVSDSATVRCGAASVWPLRVTPCSHGCRPVNMLACDGWVHDAAAKARSNVRPLAARACAWGMSEGPAGPPAKLS
jgi:hypothetical protein